MTKKTYIRLLIIPVSIALLFCSCGTPGANTSEKELAVATSLETPKAQAVVSKNDIPMIHMDSSITTDDLMGKIEPQEHSAFVEMSTKHASDKGMYLRKDAYDAFIKMFDAAQKDGVTFLIRSATRNFDRQKVIWEGKWNGTRLLEGNENAKKNYPIPKDRALKILEYSSMPGTSRHHWGTDIDINSFVNSYFEKGKGLKEYEWLVANAATYGFCQPYTPKDKDRPNGYNEEKWHWSYLPVAIKLTDQYRLRLNNEAISGFDGDETAVEIDVVRNYVLGINNRCLH